MVFAAGASGAPPCGRRYLPDLTYTCGPSGPAAAPEHPAGALFPQYKNNKSIRNPTTKIRKTKNRFQNVRLSLVVHPPVTFLCGPSVPTSRPKPKPEPINVLRIPSFGGLARLVGGFAGEHRDSRCVGGCVRVWRVCCLTGVGGLQKHSRLKNINPATPARPKIMRARQCRSHVFENSAGIRCHALCEI